MKIYFEKATTHHIDIIFDWLKEDHIQEFWDNSIEHKEDILNFIYERTQTYFAGTTKYWVGYINNEPYAFILSDALSDEQDDLSAIHKKYISKTGHTITLDFGIGNKNYLGKGFAAQTLQAFMDFYKIEVDDLANIFLIDPDENNPKAIHVYEKAGFKKVGNFEVNKGAFIGSVSNIMIKEMV